MREHPFRVKGEGGREEREGQDRHDLIGEMERGAFTRGKGGKEGGG